MAAWRRTRWEKWSWGWKAGGVINGEHPDPPAGGQIASSLTSTSFLIPKNRTTALINVSLHLAEKQVKHRGSPGVPINA